MSEYTYIISAGSICRLDREDGPSLRRGDTISLLPGSEKFDEHGLAIGFLVEGFWSKLDGGGRRRREGQEVCCLSNHLVENLMLNAVEGCGGAASERGGTNG